jgi:hypothetical protein
VTAIRQSPSSPLSSQSRSHRRLMAGHLPRTGHRRRHRLPGTPTPLQKPAGIVRCKRLILRRRNRPVLPFQKQVIMEGAVGLPYRQQCKGFGPESTKSETLPLNSSSRVVDPQSILQSSKRRSPAAPFQLFWSGCSMREWMGSLCGIFDVRCELIGRSPSLAVKGASMALSRAEQNHASGAE